MSAPLTLPAYIATPCEASTCNNRHILAERFKTRLCYNFMRTGDCPYESRCMFAHGEPELRTPEENMIDGLFTEEAIKSYQRAMRLVSRSFIPTPAHQEMVESYDGSYDGHYNTDYFVREESAKYAAPFVADSNFSTGSSYDGALSSEDGATTYTPSPVLSEVGEDEIIQQRATTPRRGVRLVSNGTSFCNDPYSA